MHMPSGILRVFVCVCVCLCWFCVCVRVFVLVLCVCVRVFVKVTREAQSDLKERVRIVHVVPIITIPIYHLIYHNYCYYYYYTRSESVLSMSCP